MIKNMKIENCYMCSLFCSHFNEFVISVDFKYSSGVYLHYQQINGHTKSVHKVLCNAKWTGNRIDIRKFFITTFAI